MDVQKLYEGGCESLPPDTPSRCSHTAADLKGFAPCRRPPTCGSLLGRLREVGSRNWPLVESERHLVASGRHLEASGDAIGVHWAPFGHHWGAIGSHWDPLGAIGMPLGCNWDAIGILWAPFGHHWGAIGIHLFHFWSSVVVSIGNMGHCEMYEIACVFIGFSMVGGILGGLEGHFLCSWEHLEASGGMWGRNLSVLGVS